MRHSVAHSPASISRQHASSTAFDGAIYSGDVQSPPRRRLFQIISAAKHYFPAARWFLLGGARGGAPFFLRRASATTCLSRRSSSRNCHPSSVATVRDSSLTRSIVG
ncbi:hypothetical protein M6B38_140685 [Iris pallida]|uniref:Uncharacterized protein n=1 Tax=Iris pallida TaxID=29817 RepID=A0AAX6FCP4_IRIPA|nr:hypothetical protein M6B38_140685 [Iris pallida]